ncbi:hypothetical protein [Bradyrhizobium sp. CB1650]|uniref:hypothetical protein n=1 Tax=Bradyrhizobium sp. CB1650 TaxID=3039153 RepID=UPI00325FBC33
MQRRRFKQVLSFQERLLKFAQDSREQAKALPPGKEKDQLLVKARQADTAAHIDDWLHLPAFSHQLRNGARVAAFAAHVLALRS